MVSGGFINMISKKYSAQYKISLVEEYFRLKLEQPKLSIAQFAYNNKIADSTFNDWIIKYKRQAIGLSKISMIDDENTPMSINKVRMKYNGAIIEFDESLLERIFKILKSW